MGDHLEGLQETILSALKDASKNENDDGGGLLAAAAALLERDPTCRETGLAKALRELAALAPRPDDPSTWLGVRLRDFRPPSETRPYEDSVLDGLVMKCDEFADIHLLPTPRLHPQTWNFRRCDDAALPVFGVGQCHIDGIDFLLGHLKEDLGYDTVKWFNMREEPVVFLNGQACSPRIEGKMNENVEYLVGIEGYELDSMELRLCSDCVDASDISEDGDNGCLGVYYQTADGGNEQRPVSTAPPKTFSIRKGYEWLAAKQKDGNNDNAAKVEYYRIPISDETAPEEKDFDQLVSELKDCLGTPGVALVFNCQMGRGRTTTGMVSACILSKAAAAASPVAPDGTRTARPSFLQRARRASAISLEIETSSAASSTEGQTPPRNKKRGEYLSILRLLETIDVACEHCTGRRAKALADACIDGCAHAQNMVEAIDACANSARTAEIGAPRSPEFWRGRAHNYLERYAYVVLFAAYALENAPTGFRKNFTEWSRRYWQFKRVLKHLTLD